MVLYMYTASKIILSYAFLPEDEDGVDTDVAAITMILMLTVNYGYYIQCKPMH